MRRSLLEPIPELNLAAKLLDAAANALLLQDNELVSGLIKKADSPKIMDYAIRLVGAMSIEIHRQTKRPNVLSKEDRHPARMPPQSVQQNIFSRDGWRCRFCNTPVISKKARTILISYFPSETHWGKKEFERHSALYAMASSLDHVVPHSRGGENSMENFVTACYCCQFGRGEWTLEEMELIDPREFPPIQDNWDGLSRI